MMFLRLMKMGSPMFLNPILTLCANNYVLASIHGSILGNFSILNDNCDRNWLQQKIFESLLKPIMNGYGDCLGTNGIGCRIIQEQILLSVDQSINDHHHHH